MVITALRFNITLQSVHYIEIIHEVYFDSFPRVKIDQSVTSQEFEGQDVLLVYAFNSFPSGVFNVTICTDALNMQ